MKANEARELTTEELERKALDLKQELFNLRFQLAIGQLENPMQLREVRKNFARVSTILRERELKSQQA